MCRTRFTRLDTQKSENFQNPKLFSRTTLKFRVFENKSKYGFVLRDQDLYKKIETKTVMGCLLYITLALIIMGSSQWKKPSSFYLKYESAHFNSTIPAL